MEASQPNSVPTFYAKDRKELRQWLAEHHASEKAAWVVYDKGKDRTLPYDDLVEEALCFGWIDSKPGVVSDTQSKLYISKRKPKSAWSKSNKVRIEKLSAAGLLEAPGIEAVRIAKENGSWDALNRSDNFEIPPELAKLLAENPTAKAFYESLSPSSHKIILEWIYSAKKDETRQARITETVELAAQGIKAHHYRQ